MQAFVVAGGSSPSGARLSSVLTLLQGAGSTWTPLASLPRALAGARASVAGGKLRVTGGFDGAYRYRSEVLVKINLENDTSIAWACPIIVNAQVLLMVRCLNISLLGQSGSP